MMGCGASNSIAISPAQISSKGQSVVSKCDLRDEGSHDSDLAVADSNIEETDCVSLRESRLIHRRTEDSLDDRSRDGDTRDPSHTQLPQEEGWSAQSGCAQLLTSEVQVHASMATSESFGSVLLESALHSPSPSNQEPLDQETPRQYSPRAGTADQENQSPPLAANTRDESSHTPAIASNQCQRRLAGDVDEQATSKRSPPKDVSGAGMRHDQLITPTSAQPQAIVGQTACHSFSQSFEIQSLQFKLGFIGVITVNRKNVHNTK